jgi:hypothetical protein
MKDGENSVQPESQEMSSGQDTKNDVVQYETYKRVLSDHKKSKARAEELAAKLAEIEQKEKDLEETRLKEQGEYKKLLDIERKKREVEESKRIQYEKNLIDAHKLNAVKERLPGKIKRNEYYSFIDTDKVLIDPETGIIDETSIEEVVNGFLAEHTSLIDVGNTVKLPQHAASGSVSKISYDDWLKLPLKEKRKRMKDVK